MQSFGGREKRRDESGESCTSKWHQAQTPLHMHASSALETGIIGDRLFKSHLPEYLSMIHEAQNHHRPPRIHNDASQLRRLSASG